MDEDGAQEYLDNVISELTHSVINHNKTKTFEYGINGYDYLKSTPDYNKAYITKGNFENTTHGGNNATKRKDKYHAF